MKELENDKICKYCFGCEKLANENFKGVRSCINFIQARDMSEYYLSLKEAKDEQSSK